MFLFIHDFLLLCQRGRMTNKNHTVKDRKTKCNLLFANNSEEVNSTHDWNLLFQLNRNKKLLNNY